jgi:hypothetical protein
MVQDEQYRSFLSSKRRYFYGVRVQLLTTSDGIALEFCVAGRVFGFAGLDGTRS